MQTTKRARCEKGSLVPAPHSGDGTVEVINLIQDSDKEKAEKKGKAQRKAKTTQMFEKYAVLSQKKGECNYAAVCKIRKCGARGYNSTFLKAHLPTHFGDPTVGRELIEDFKRVYPKRLGVIQQDIRKFCSEVPKEEAPTESDFETIVLRFVIGINLPFSTFDKPDFIELLQICHRMGQHDVRLPLFSARTFTRKCLPTLVDAQVAEALSKHRNGQQTGSTMQFDSVTGKDGTTINNWIVTTGDFSSLVASSRSGSERHTSQLIADYATCVLSRQELFLAGRDVVLDEQFVAKKDDHDAIDAAIQPLLGLCKRVWAVGSDSASNVQGALVLLRDDLGIVDYACVVHAMSNLAKEIGDLLYTEVVTPVIKVVNFFSIVWQIQGAPKRGVPARADSGLHHALFDLVPSHCTAARCQGLHYQCCQKHEV